MKDVVSRGDTHSKSGLTASGRGPGFVKLSSINLIIPQVTSETLSSSCASMEKANDVPFKVGKPNEQGEDDIKPKSLRESALRLLLPDIA